MPASARAVDSEGGAEVGWLSGRLGCSATGRTTPEGLTSRWAATGPGGCARGVRRSPPFHCPVYLPGGLATRSPQALRPCLRPVHTLLRLPVRVPAPDGAREALDGVWK